MNNLIQAITDYTTALEQKLSALEARVDELEEANEAMRREGDEAKALIATLQAEVAALAAAGVAVTPAEEPEVEIELIVEDPQEQETPEEPVVEPAAELIVEPALQPEVKAEPVAAPQPAPRPVPQQPSLFGAAVEDIRQAISLGDRFLFQRELFAGNGELMQKTLDELNALGSLEEAMDYVADNFEWDSDSTAVQLFENVLKRRFA